MKKVFTFVLALMAAMAINATDYFFAGAANGWSNNNDAWKFVEVDGVLTLEVADLYGDFKITEDGYWHPQHGAAAAGEGVALNGSYNLVKCVDTEENPEAEAPANCKILIPEEQGEGEWRYKNAVLTLDATNPDALVISLAAGTIYDHSQAPKTYQIVGAFNGWDAAGAPSFEEVDGVLTVTVEDLNGTFKIIEEHAWHPQHGADLETQAGLPFGEAYVLGGEAANGEAANLALANPFGGYRNAVLTLEINGDEFVLTLVSGEFYVTEANWFVPGGWNDWKCNDVAKMSPVEGAENTYELLLAEFSGEFKVVYGDWAVEFGRANGIDEAEGLWAVNTLYDLAFPCGNMIPADASAVYEDVTITLVVDYENVAATLMIAVAGEEGIETIQLNANSIKRIENGQLLIEREGVRYNMNGIAQ